MSGRSRLAVEPGEEIGVGHGRCPCQISSISCESLPLILASAVLARRALRADAQGAGGELHQRPALVDRRRGSEARR